MSLCEVLGHDCTLLSTVSQALLLFLSDRARSKKSRWRDKGTKGIVMATWSGLLRVGPSVRFRNFVVVIKKPLF